MNKVKVSIIVPVYNSEAHLKTCIESILNQSFKDFELILVDDGSTDKSYVICQRYEIQDKRVKLLQQINSGASEARNLGLKHVNGEFLMFVDSDDYIEVNMLQILVNTAKREEADYVVCGMVVDFFNKKGGLSSSVKYNLSQRIIEGNNNIPREILDLVENEKISGPCCKLIKTSIVKENKVQMPSNIALQEDLYFNLKVLSHVNRLCVISDTLYHYNQGFRETVTSRYYSSRYDMTNEVHDLLMKFYVERCNDEKVLERIKYIYIKNTYASFMNLFHQRCSLTRKEKILYIKEITHSDKYNEMVFGANKKGIKYKVLAGILKSKNKILIYYSSKLFNVMKSTLGIKY